MPTRTRATFSICDGNRIAFIDFGMVGRLSERRRDELLNLLLGLVERNAQDGGRCAARLDR